MIKISESKDPQDIFLRIEKELNSKQYRTFYYANKTTVDIDKVFDIGKKRTDFSGKFGLLHTLRFENSNLTSEPVLYRVSQKVSFYAVNSNNAIIEWNLLPDPVQKQFREGFKIVGNYLKSFFNETPYLEPHYVSGKLGSHFMTLEFAEPRIYGVVKAIPSLAKKLDIILQPLRPKGRM